MSFTVPTGDGQTPFFDLQVTLDDATYTLEFRWNVRLGAWFMSILDEQGTTQIMSGIRLVANWLLSPYTIGNLPPGAFVAWDTSGQGLDPGLGDLGSRVKLIYITQAELAAGSGG